MQGTLIRPLGPEDPLEEGMATPSSVLAWRIPWTEEPGELQFIVLQREKAEATGHAHTHGKCHCRGMNEVLWSFRGEME